MAAIPITFPTDRQRIRRQVDDERDLTPDQRLAVLCDMLDMAATLNPTDDVFGSKDSIWLSQEAAWQRSIRELFQRKRADCDRR